MLFFRKYKKVSGSGFRVPCFGFRVPGFGFSVRFDGDGEKKSPKLQPCYKSAVIDHRKPFEALETVDLDIHEDIIRRSIAGDRKAQYRLYQLYAKAMLNICMRMMSGREDAEDMLQESFAEAFRRLHTFRFESTFGAWLKRIVVNRCINELRRRKADLRYFEDMHLFEGRKEEEDTETGLSVEKVKSAMKELPNGSRMIFSLYLLEGYDHIEIAEILNISVSNSKSQYMRARQRVKELLTQMNYEN